MFHITTIIHPIDPDQTCFFTSPSTRHPRPPTHPPFPPQPTTYHGALQASGMRFGVVVGRFNSLVTDLLLNGCLEAFERHGCDVSSDVQVAWVPGSFELPLVASSMAKTGKYDAIVCIGAVVRGATTHYDEVCSAATSGIQNVSNSTGVPTIFGVITTETMEQAQDRAGGKVGNKGFEAGVTAIEMGNLLKELRADGHATGPTLN